MKQGSLAFRTSLVIASRRSAARRAGAARGVLVVLLLAAPAHAQVTMDLKALDQPNAPARPKPVRPPPTPRLVPAPGNAHIAPPATLPTSIPPVVRLAPDIVGPEPAAPAPPAPPPIAAEAATKADPLPNGLRVIFAAGAADLSPDSDAAIAAMAAAAASKGGDVTYDVRAYATGTQEDPSTPRRLSLARALAVRASLIARGVASPHIYVRALGAAATPDDAAAPQDRADVTIAGPDGSPKADAGAQKTAGAK
jgi:outer membrane protein OmpA-like peptidoglycan-associated protein